MSEIKDWGRKKAGSIRELALNLSFELGSLSEDLMQKARYSSTEIIELIDTVDSAIGTLRDDMCKYYDKHLNRLSEEFYRYGALDA